MPDTRQKPPYHNLPYVETGEHARPFHEICDQHDAPFDEITQHFLDTSGICRILDMCCGNSGFASYLGRQFPNAEIVRLDEYSDEERGYDEEDPPNVSFMQGDANNPKLQLPDMSFNIITATWGPSFYSRETVYIENIGRLLTVRGQAFVRPEPLSLEEEYWRSLRLGLEGPHEGTSDLIVRKARAYSDLRDLGCYVQFDFDGSARRLEVVKRPL